MGRLARWQDQLVVGSGGVEVAEVGTGESILERAGGVAERGTKATLLLRELWFCCEGLGHKCSSLRRAAAAPGPGPSCQSSEVLTGFDFCLPEAIVQCGEGSAYRARQS